MCTTCLLYTSYNIDFNGWHVEGDLFEWDYTITGPDGGTVAAVSKEPFHWTDTYVLAVSYTHLYRISPRLGIEQREKEQSALRWPRVRLASW